MAAGRRAAVLRLISAEPDAFLDGPVSIGGRQYGFRKGAELETR